MEILEKLDNSLKSIEKKELTYIYIMIFGGIFFLSYHFLFELSEKALKTVISEKKRVSKEVREYKNYLSFHDSYEINQLKNRVIKLKENIDIFKAKKEFISNKIQSLSNVIYDKESWTQFLKSISKVANSSGVEIYYIKNQFIENIGSNIFQNHLNVQIKMNSTYINTLQFIDKIERNSLIVNIDNLDMSLTENGVTTELFISVWGIKIGNR